MKISEAFYDYRRQIIVGRNCSINTDRSYMYASRLFIKYFGDINIKKITERSITDFYLFITNDSAKLKGFRPLVNNTAREYISRLKSVIGYCYSLGIKTMNPAHIELPRPEKKYVRFIDQEEYDKFISAASRPSRGYSLLNRQRNALICKMLFNTGLRVGELCALNRDTIHDRQFVVIGKSKEPRVCFITEEIENDLKAYLAARQDDSPALFVSNETGERIAPHTVQSMFRRVAKLSNLPKVTPHTMRHSFATRLVEEGVDIRYIAAFLGHQNLDTTRIYTHVRDFKLKEIYENVIEK